MISLKNVFLLLSIFLLSGCINSSFAQTPKEVKETFKKQYPNENDPDWHIDKNGNYEANFKQDGKQYRADYNADGSWIETERNIKKKQLPIAVRNAIKANYKCKIINEIEEVDHFSKGRFYDVEFKIKGVKRDVEFNAEGIKLN